MRNPNLCISGSWIASWRMPPTKSPYDSEIIGITKSDAENIVKNIRLKFKNTGVIPDNINLIPITSFVNHSINPNIVYRKKYNSWYSTKDIKKDDELVTNYRLKKIYKTHWLIIKLNKE